MSYKKVPESMLSEKEKMRVWRSRGKGRYEMDPIDEALMEARQGAKVIEEGLGSANAPRLKAGDRGETKKRGLK